MSDFTSVSKTLYIPLQGRAYASIVYPEVFQDKKAESIWNKVPNDIKSSLVENQTDYTLLASAVRSNNADLYINRFLKSNKCGSVVNIGCGLEDFYYRNDNGLANWFNLDFKEVLEVRKQYYKHRDREHDLSYDMFDYRWIDEVKKVSDEPVLVVVCGVFHYFTESRVIDFLNAVNRIEKVEIVFDAVSTAGLKVAQKFVRDTGNEEAMMYFGFDILSEFINKLDFVPLSYSQMRYYSQVRKKNIFSADTMLRFSLSDKLGMIKMVHINYPLAF